MKERPILFSAPMVRAILEGRKTQTRRVVKPQPVDFYDGMFWYEDGDACMPPCRYGSPGDRLWVRETFSIERACDGNEPPHNDGRPIKRGQDFEEPAWYQAHYRASDAAPDLTCESDRCRVCESKDFGPHWKPSIHMPRWASRIDLEVTGVRVERLQDISYENACAEGCALENMRFEPVGDGETWEETARRLRWPQRSYEQLWESINGPESWAANPWVWVVQFKRVTP